MMLNRLEHKSDTPAKKFDTVFAPAPFDHLNSSEQHHFPAECSKTDCCTEPSKLSGSFIINPKI